MSDTTFDASKNYKKVCYRADRDLLNTELNESQDIEIYERRVLLDKILAQGTIISGFSGTVDDADVTINEGIVYLDGCAVSVPGTTVTFSTPGEHLIYLDVFHRDVTASDDPTLVNPITGEPTAEREKWIATLQTRDTTNDPLPDGAISRTVAPVYIFNRDTGELLPYVGSSVQGGDIISAFSNHAGHGGIDRHPAVTSEIAGFMTPEQMDILESIEVALPTKADDVDVVNLSNALNGHRTSSDHDGRYYTESEIEANFAPIGHVGAGGDAHSVATISQAGFMDGVDKIQLDDHETRVDAIELVLPDKADNADVADLSDALDTHKSSADHDGRYYTESESNDNFAPLSHVGAGGSSHSVATTSQSGFMDSTDKSQLDDHETRIDSIETTLPGKADDSDITTLIDALDTHKSSADHDTRYYTESESDDNFAPIIHVGSVGASHGLASSSDHGFISKQLYSLIRNTIHWECIYDYGNDGLAAMPYGIISTANGFIWRGKCDENSTHRISTAIRMINTPMTAAFELYHQIGNVSIETGSRITLEDWVGHPTGIPGGRIYDVELYPDSFTNIQITVTGSGEVGFSLNIFPGDDRQICYAVDPDRVGKPIV